MHPYLSLYINRQLPFTIRTNYISSLINIFFNRIGLNTCRSRIDNRLGRPWLDLSFLKIGTGNISSGNIKSVDVFPVDYDVEGIEYEVILRADLPAVSKMKAQIETICVADSFGDNNAPADELCSSVATLK